MQLSETVRTRLAWTAIALLGALLAWALGAVLTPFLIALTLAYAMHPTVERLQRWRVPRALGAALAIVLLSLLLVALASLIVAVLGSTLPQLQQQVPALQARVNVWVVNLAAQLGLQAPPNVASVGGLLNRAIAGDPTGWLERVLSSARNGGSTLMALLTNLLLIPLLTFYVLMDWANLMRRSHSLVPLQRREALRGFLHECDVVLGRYVRGQLAVMVILAGYYALGLSLAGFELALPIGVFTGLAVCVPFIGFGLGLLLALLAGALQFQSLYAVWAVAVVFGIGEVLESSYLTPRLLGHHIGIHPLLVMFLLLAFGHLFGVLSVPLALPAGALLAVVARHVMVWYRASPLFLKS